MMRFVGDIHGDMNSYLNIIHGIDESIQVGDYGIGFVENPIITNNHRFIRGNHDNPSLCKEQINYIPDGYIENDMMFMGGALSIDKEYRTIGIDYWDDEELSISQLNDMIDLYDANRPSIMVTHEAPESILYHFNRSIYPIHSRTRAALDAMWNIHKPKLWICGHWHFPFDKIVDGCRFIVLDINCHIDIDVKDL